MPKFICVGVQKGGTSTLHNMLAQHESLYLPPEKELHYFTNNYDKGRRWYSDKFREASKDQLAGEVTPYYIYHPHAPERIRDTVGNIKIIVLLRDPVERTLSHYWHSVTHGFEKENLDRALILEDERLANIDHILIKAGGRVERHQENSYISRSIYRNQVTRLWRLFGEENVILIPSELLFNQHERVMKYIFNFLGVNDKMNIKLSYSNMKDSKINYKIEEGLRGRIRELLNDSYEFCFKELEWGSMVKWYW